MKLSKPLKSQFNEAWSRGYAIAMKEGIGDTNEEKIVIADMYARGFVNGLRAQRKRKKPTKEYVSFYEMGSRGY